MLGHFIVLLHQIAKQADKTADAIARMKLQNLPTADIEKSITTAREVGMRIGISPELEVERAGRLS
jgi:hypothetical protein